MADNTTNPPKTAQTQGTASPEQPIVKLGPLAKSLQPGPVPLTLIGLSLLIFGALLFLVREQMDPLLLGLAGLAILYPYRGHGAVKLLMTLISFPMLVSLAVRLKALLIPFVIALILAYALNPVVEWLTRRKLPRWLVILIMAAAALGCIVGLGLLVIPVLFSQIAALYSNVTNWQAALADWFNVEMMPRLTSLGLPPEVIREKIQANIPTLFSGIMDKIGGLGNGALSVITALITGLANLVLIPILTVYFLSEFPRIKHLTVSLFPAEQHGRVRHAYGALNGVLGAYFRGQALVVLFLSTWIGLGLWLIAGVPYALLLGLAAGILNLLPYVGTTSALIVTMMIALFQPNPVGTALKALAVFVSAQTIEGNFITPRLVGDRVGLHPLVVIFLVLAFGTLFGFIGLLIAIPLSASARALYLSLHSPLPDVASTDSRR